MHVLYVRNSSPPGSTSSSLLCICSDPCSPPFSHVLNSWLPWPRSHPIQPLLPWMYSLTPTASSLLLRLFRNPQNTLETRDLWVRQGQREALHLRQQVWSMRAIPLSLTNGQKDKGCHRFLKGMCTHVTCFVPAGTHCYHCGTIKHDFPTGHVSCHTVSVSHDSMPQTMI